MKGARILQFGPPSVITIDDLPRPAPAPGELLVRASAAGVGYWDALVREGKIPIPDESLPLILGFVLDEHRGGGLIRQQQAGLGRALQ